MDIDITTKFDWDTEFDKETLMTLMNKLPFATQPIIVLAYGNYKLAEFIEVHYVQHEIAMIVIDPLLDDKLCGNVCTAYGAPVFSSLEKVLEEFSDLETDKCCLVCENSVTEDDIVIISKVHPTNIFVITDLTGKCGGSSAFHYWMDHCVNDRPLVNLCCYKGELEFSNVDARSAYYKALSKNKYSASIDRMSKIVDNSEFSAFLLVKENKSFDTDFWWPSDNKRIKNVKLDGDFDDFVVDDFAENVAFEL